MGKKDILNWFTVNSEALSTEKIVFVLGMALFVALLIFVTYRITYNGVSYSRRFNVTNIVILLITAVVMLMISTNIAISLGMVGALSIVRYRSAIKDPHDTVYIFWSIVEGLCVGAQMYKLAICSTIFIALVLLIMSLYSNIQQKYLIIVRGKADSAEAALELIRKVYPKARVKAMNNMSERYEMICEISIKKEISMQAINNLRKTEGVESANWLLETGENIG